MYSVVIHQANHVSRTQVNLFHDVLIEAKFFMSNDQIKKLQTFKIIDNYLWTICLNERLQQNNLITEFRILIHSSLRIINANGSANLYKKYAICNAVRLRLSMLAIFISRYTRAWFISRWLFLLLKSVYRRLDLPKIPPKIPRKICLPNWDRKSVV